MSRSLLVIAAFALTVMACGGSSSSTPTTTSHLTFKTAGAADVAVNVGEAKEVSLAAGREFLIEAPGQTSWSFGWDPAGSGASVNVSTPLGGDTYGGTITTSVAVKHIVKVRFSSTDVRTATLTIDVTP
jgi:hypothetical protein